MSILKTLLSIFFTYILFISTINGKATRMQREEACKDVGKLYLSEKVKNSSLTQYVEYLTSKKAITIDNDSFFLNLIIKGNVENLSSIISKILFYLIIIIIGILIIFTYPIFYICWCCHCCVFKKHPCQNKCGFGLYIASITLLSLMVISSIVSFVYSGNFIKHFDGSTCSFLNFFHHGLNGDEGEVLPRWVGTAVLSLTVDGAKNSLLEIEKNKEQAFSQHQTKILDAYSAYNNKILQTKNNFYKTVSSISNKNIYTSYAKQFKDVKKNETYIGQLYFESQLILRPIVEALDGLKKVSDDIITNLLPIQTALDDLSVEIENMDKTIADISDSVTGNFVDFQNTVDDIILLIFRIILGIFFIVSLATIGLITMMEFLNLPFLKIFFHIVWNILILFVIVSFILGGLVGAVYIIVLELIPAISYILSPEYLQKEFGSDSDTAYALNSCLNGDGQLSKVFNIEGGNVDLVNTFYALGILIKILEESFSKYSSSLITPIIKKGLEEIKDDFSLSTSPDSDYSGDSVNYHLSLLNNLISTECPSVNDIFVTNSNQCPSSYVYRETAGVQGNNNCYSIIKFSSLPSYYTSTTCNNNNLQNIKDKHLAIYNFINTNIGSTSDSNSLNKILDENEKIAQSFSELAANIKNEIEGTGVITSTIISIIEPLVGKNEFYDMFNCGFIKSDLIMFFDQFMNKFATDCLGISVCCIVSSTLVYISIYFILVSYYSKIRIKEKKEDNKEDVNDENNNNENKLGHTIELKETDKILNQNNNRTNI